MKIPHTINSNYFKEYAASAAALQLIPDSSRILKSEDQTWDEFYPRRLNELCVAVLVANFQKRITLNEMPPWDRNLLLETLPTNLPLPLVTQHINDGIYWKRKVKDKWKDEANYCQDYDFNWKRMFLEKHVEEAVEAMTPEGTFESENKAINLKPATRNQISVKSNLKQFFFNLPIDTYVIQKNQLFFFLNCARK